MQAKTNNDGKPKKASKGPRTTSLGNKKERWNNHFQECKEYYQKFGHCKIPTCFKDNKKLGNWVQEQRRNFKLLKQGKKPRFVLTDEQIDKLDEIKFHWGWTPDPNASAESDASWEANFDKLQEYHATHENFDIPMESDTLKLSQWARAQRHQKKLKDSKVKSFMTKEREKKLDGIGFDWNGPRKFDK